MGIWRREAKTEAKTPGTGRRRATRARRPKVSTEKSPGRGQGSTWTGGRDLLAKAFGAALLAAVVCGPAALAVTLSRGTPTAVADTSARVSGLSVAEQSAGSYALSYVGAWLSASRTDSTELEKYVTASSIQNLTEQPWSYRDAAVVSISPAAVGELVSVIVAANVSETLPGEADDGTTQIWPRRYFQAAVTVDEQTGALRAVGLPAPVAAPDEPDTAPDLVYTSPLPASSSAASAVTAFLGAYLADSGEISRYTSPATEISAISPAPYVTLDADDLRVDVVPSDVPVDGDTARVLATVTLTTALEQKLTATYAVTITARANRWEVSSLDPVPEESLPAGEATHTTSTPSPTGGSPKGN